MSHLITAFTTELEAERVDTLENDYIVSNFINTEFQGYDRQGWEKKWFDYRHMTTLQATHAYMEAYTGVYQRIYAREFDRERAEFIKPLNFDLILAALRPGAQADKAKVTKAKKQLVGCWRGRQIADMLCMPYAVYLDCVFTYRMRAWKQNNMPQPSHLYHRIDVEKTADRWEELKASRLYLAEHSAYLVQNYEDLQQQNDYHEYLFGLAEMRQNAPFYIATFIEEHRLPLDKARARYDDHVWNQVESYLQ
jgi:hypothetical protein